MSLQDANGDTLVASRLAAAEIAQGTKIDRVHFDARGDGQADSYRLFVRENQKCPTFSVRSTIPAIDESGRILGYLDVERPLEGDLAATLYSELWGRRPDHVFLCDGQGFVLDYKALETEISCSPGQSLSEVLAAAPFTSIDAAGEVWESLWMNTGPIYFTHVGVAETGAVYQEFYSVPLWTNSHKRAGSIIYIRDVRHEVDWERGQWQLLRVQIVQQIAQALAHELRNPLATISGFAQLLKNQTVSPDKAAAYLDIMRGELRRVDHMIDSYLAFGEVYKAERRPLSLSEICRASALDIAVHMQKHAIDFAFSTEPSPLMVRADARHLKRMIRELLDNALDATPCRGHIAFSLRREGDFAVIAIEDDGRGLPQAVVSHVFDPLYTSKTGGTGLGLSIVKEIVEVHSGRISLRSSAGEGTTVTVSFPLWRQPPIGAPTDA